MHTSSSLYVVPVTLLCVQVLNLNSCQLDTLPAGINAFTALKVLDLGHNGMVDLPDSLTSLSHLECLNLQGNCFPILPQVEVLTLVTPSQLLLLC